MPDLNHRFSSGRMNKDLDERLVPNGEYRDALNIEVTTSEGSDMGTVQTLKGNVNLSLELQDPRGFQNYYCVGSIVDEKNDKIYWLISGTSKDIIAEYDYKTKTTIPVVVDNFISGTLPGNDSGRVLNFDKSLLITGINIIEDLLFWTDNYTEPKRIHIERCKMGSVDFGTQTQFYVRDAADINPNNEFIPIGPIKQEHITVIRKRPPAAPVLEMRNTLRSETEESLASGSFLPEFFLNIYGHFKASTINTNPFVDQDGLITSSTVTVDFQPFTGTTTYPDFHNGDYIRIYPGVDEPDGDNYIRAQIVTGIDHTVGWNGACEIQVLSGDKTLDAENGDWYIVLEDGETLFKFKFPRFATRYKYEDGEYSAFSPFTQIAFLPTDFDYRHKEGYNLGMVNNLRFLAIKDFVHGRQIPDDVISIDILYKESNSPNVYTVKTVKRFTNDWKPGWAPPQVPSPSDAIQKYSEWNAIGPSAGVGSDAGVNNIASNQRTRGWTRITNEMIHAVLPANQLLRPWDNVPRAALAQEVTGNRIVYANYLQNFNLYNTQSTVSSALLNFSQHNYGELEASKDIDIDINIGFNSKQINADAILPEQKNAFLFGQINSLLNPAKSVKTLRTYQLGVVYIDEFGRETPVFSDTKKGENSIYIEKDNANKATNLTGQIFNIAPEWAKYYKFFIKETSGEYYNLAMDRWYNAEDGNIWLSFASSERNKVDLETFLILKKAHDSDRAIYEDPAQDNYQGFIKNKARYKIISISNEAPIFVKTTKTNKPTFNDGGGDLIATASGVGFPQVGTNNVYIDRVAADAAGWGAILGVAEGADRVDISKFEIRFKGPEIIGSVDISAWYKIKSVSLINIGSGFYNIVVQKLFKHDIKVLSITGTYASYSGGGSIELVENIVENKPEFDGRFFVKIKKDVNLIENIIQESSQSKNLIVTQALQSQYINPQSEDSSGARTQGVYEEWYGTAPTIVLPLVGAFSKCHQISISEENDTSWFSAGHEGIGESYWDKASRSEAASTDVNAESNGWFIDKVEGFRPFKYTKYFFDIDDQFGVDDRHHPDGGSPVHAHFQISNATPGGGGGNIHHQYLDLYEDRGGLQVLGTNTFASAYDNYLLQAQGTNTVKVYRPQLYTDGTPIGTAPNDPATTGKSIISELRNAPGSQNGKIVPSIGIDATDNIIHLSYSGIGDDGNPIDVPENLSELKLDFSDFSSYNQYVSDQLFINSICTPGTIWRWAEDPDRITYITKTPKFDDIDQTSSEWAYNTRDNINHGSYYGVSLYNYVTFQDYLTTHTHTLDDGTTVTHWSWASQGFKDHDGDDFDFPTEDPPGSENWVLQQDNASGVTGNPSSIPLGIAIWTTWELDYGRGSGNTGAALGIEHNGGTNNLRFGRTAGDWSFGNWITPNPTAGITGGYASESATNCHYYHPQRVREFWKGIAKRRRYQFHAVTYESDGAPSQSLGVKGTSKYLPTNPTDLPPHFDVDSNGVTSVKTTIPSTPAPGIRSDGMYSGATLMSGTEIPFFKTEDASNNISEAPGSVTWQILEPYSEYDELNYSSSNPAIWETEPKEQVDLNIYQEIGQVYPIELNDNTNEQFVGPVHPRTYEYYNSYVQCYKPNGARKVLGTDGGPLSGGNIGGIDIRVRRIEDNILYLCDVQGTDLTSSAPNPIFPAEGEIIEFVRADGGSTRTYVLAVDETTGAITLARDLHNHKVTLPWHNCYSFGNGVESDRIRDDYNQITIDNGPKASATLDEPYEEERRGSGFIWSGIYNSRSGVNNLNQFIQAEKITKDLNPIYGTIQKLFSRNTNLLAFCEDKVFKVLANKDALFNADGNANITATSRVLGATTPFSGDFGISKNPESFATESFRNYFTDKVRGTVVRLSQDGMTPISDFGMQDYFSDNLKNANRLIGTFDEKKQEYNLTFDHSDYPKPTPPIIMGTAWVQIEGEIGMASVGQTSTSTYEPTNRLIAPTNVPVMLGQIVEGPGLKPGTIVTNTSIQYGILYIEISPTPDLADVSPLLGPSDAQYYNEWYTSITILQPSSYTSTFENSTNALDKTISFSERSKGWVSFKSFIPENGVSLNNTYYTFKGGNLWEHHANETRNNFYTDQYDSSIEVLFNEAPGVIKSFQTLNYEGTLSRVTSDTTNNGEYWDNNIKFGWYVDNMITDLQEAGQQEFKSKERKWFSQIKGVATEWLDDGKAGNIDTREFSYQGIDNNYDKSIVSGGFTSWDCIQHISYDQPDSACTTDLAKSLDGNLYVHYDLAAATAAGDPSLQNPSWINYYMQNASGTNYTNYMIIGGVGFGASEAYTDWSSSISMATPTVQNPCYVNGVDNSQGHYIKNDGLTNPSGQSPHIKASLIYIHAISPPMYHSNGMDILQAMNNKLLVWELEYDANGNSIFPANVESLKDIAIANNTPYADGPEPCICLPSTSGGTSHDCVEIQGNSGTYATESMCLSDPNTSCGVVGTSWACDARLGCHEVTGLSGGYSSWCDCIQNSSCCVQYGNSVAGLDGVGMISNSSIQYYTDNCDASAIYGCMDDGITTNTEIINNRPYTWSGEASNYNQLANIHTCDCEYTVAPISYDCVSDGMGGFNCQNPGTGLGYYATLNDCLNDPNGNCVPAIPCDPNMPYQFQYSITDATGISGAGSPCNPTNADGQIILGINNLGANAANIYVELYEDNGSGNLGNLVFGNQSTQYFVNDNITIPTLVAADYIFRFEDDNGCVYTMPMSVGCNFTQPPACNVSNFNNTTNVTQSLSAIRCDLISSLTQLGKAEITVPLNGYGTNVGNFNVTVQALSQPTSPTYFDITNLLTFNGATMQSPLQTFTFGSTVIIDGITPSTIQASNYSLFTNGYQFQITITDSNGCHITEIIEIPCQAVSLPDYDCVAHGTSFICNQVASGTGNFSGVNALVDCQNAIATNTHPCYTTTPTSSPCPNSDYLSDTDFGGISGTGYGSGYTPYTPQLLHAWGGNYRCNNTIFPASCATSYVNEFFGDAHNFVPTPFTPGSYEINPIGATNGPWTPAIIYNVAKANEWSLFSSDKGSLPTTIGGPAGYSQTPLATPPGIDSNGHVRLNGFMNDGAKSTHAILTKPVTQGLYMEVLNLAPNTVYSCVITFGTDWNNGVEGFGSGPSIGNTLAGEIWIGFDQPNGHIIANNGVDYSALNLDPGGTGVDIATFPSGQSPWGGVIQDANWQSANYNQMVPGGVVGFTFEKSASSAFNNYKDLLVVSLVSYDVQHLSIASICISPYATGGA